MQNEAQHQPGLNEIELKLRIAEVDAPTLFKHPSIQKSLFSPPQTRRLISVYYDTPMLQLLDAGISLRVRSMSGGWFQAVKSTGSSVAGLHQRMEWEDIISGPEPDFSKITEPSLAAIFADLELRQALKPIFTTDVNRTEWQLAYETSQIELALDIGKLIIHSQSDKAIATESDISEIELELKQGNPSDVFTLAIALQQDIPLTIENTSKAEYGYAYFRSIPFKSAASVPPNNHLEIPWDCLQALQDGLKNSNDDTPILIKSAANRLSHLITSSAKNEQKLLLSELEWLQELCEKTSENEQLQAAINSQRYQGLLLKLAACLLK
ncbi:CYTH domain-containing protein [Methyloradius palustris]|uniref:CYTH domain-containing protein n=1 Tax=Methyloradius palustris TaxID=2778876 RepID=A0A8D5G0G9_9PROT|nr:CYTH domain-containing protein [Methyloradius palustris]BCM25684.1 hypothetical protein ZMTM_19430 [Methyloradius palustris]